jgi:transposase-like protein
MFGGLPDVFLKRAFSGTFLGSIYLTKTTLSGIYWYMVKQAGTLLEVIRKLKDLQVAHEFFVSIRWPNGAWCPRMGCGSADVARIGARNVWRCRDCKQQFTVKVGTVFEDSPIGFDKWIPAMWMLNGDRNETSSCELARKIGVTQKSAWFMLHRIRLAMETGSFIKGPGDAEADETFIGGLAHDMSKTRRAKTIKGTGGAGKEVVMGVLRRGNETESTKVKAKHVPDTGRPTLHAEI